MQQEVIGKEEINRILTRYCIGKKPLAKLLGWGETTIIRYLEGDVPSGEYSDKLKRIGSNLAYYYSVLEENQEKITKVAYQKSLRAVYAIAVSHRVNVFVHYMKNTWDGALPNEGYQCLLYYLQGFSMAIYAKPAFFDEYLIADERIPYSQLEKNFFIELQIPMAFLEQEMTMREKMLLDALVKAFAWYGYPAMREILLQEQEGFRISRNRDNERIISKDTIEKYFRWITKEYMILKPDDIWKYVDSKYAEIRNWKLLSLW